MNHGAPERAAGFRSHEMRKAIFKQMVSARPTADFTGRGTGDLRISLGLFLHHSM